VILVLGNAVWVKLGKCDNGFAFDVFNLMRVYDLMMEHWYVSDCELSNFDVGG
jgi:hypothetical protein